MLEADEEVRLTMACIGNSDYVQRALCCACLSIQRGIHDHPTKRWLSSLTKANVCVFRVFSLSLGRLFDASLIGFFVVSFGFLVFMVDESRQE